MPVNKIQDFPTISDIEDNIESENVEQQREPKKKLRFLLFICGAIIVLLVVIVYAGAQNRNVAQSPRTGNITGLVTNELSTPVPAQISLLQSDSITQTDNDGSFSLNNVPVGSQKIIIAYDGMGTEIVVQVEADMNNSIGQIKVVSTAFPSE